MTNVDHLLAFKADVTVPYKNKLPADVTSDPKIMKKLICRKLDSFSPPRPSRSCSCLFKPKPDPMPLVKKLKNAFLTENLSEIKELAKEAKIYTELNEILAGIFFYFEQKQEQEIRESIRSRL